MQDAWGMRRGNPFRPTQSLDTRKGKDEECMRCGVLGAASPLPPWPAHCPASRPSPWPLSAARLWGRRSWCPARRSLSWLEPALYSCSRFPARLPDTHKRKTWLTAVWSGTEIATKKSPNNTSRTFAGVQCLLKRLIKLKPLRRDGKIDLQTLKTNATGGNCWEKKTKTSLPLSLCPSIQSSPCSVHNLTRVSPRFRGIF